MVQPTGGDYRMTPVDTPRHVRGVHGRVAPPSTRPTDWLVPGRNPQGVESERDNTITPG